MAAPTTLVLWACKNNKINVLKECIESEYDLNQTDMFYNSSLIFACKYECNIDLIQLLCEHVNINHTNAAGKKASFYAKTEELKTFLQNKEEEIGRTNQQIPVLMHKVWANEFDDIKELIANKQVDLNQLDINGNSVFGYFSSITDTKICDFLISKGAKTYNRGKNGKIPLMLSALRNDNKLFDLFLNKNQNVNFIDSDGNSILAYAALNGNFEMVAKLIANGANVNDFGSNGKPPISWAVIAGNGKMVEFLLNRSADISLTDFWRKTALDYAIKYKYENIITLLTQFRTGSMTARWGPLAST